MVNMCITDTVMNAQLLLEWIKYGDLQETV